MGSLKVAMPKKAHQLTSKEEVRRIHIFDLEKNNTYCKCYSNESLPNDKYDIVIKSYNSIYNNKRLCLNCKRHYNKKWGRHA
tara:strand:- start:49 stop:294 length:246 start_codon:yes stop_codon:yes gene_type:complete